jgi:GDPmannose 4,6-dehydratase
MAVVVVGSDGQDGRILVALLRAAGRAVVEVSRGGRTDITDARDVAGLIREVVPDEVYYLPAVHQSSEDPESAELELFHSSYEVHCMGLVNFLEAIRTSSERSRLFYAGSSLVFGDPVAPLQDEGTPFDPTTVYGITKAAGISTCRYYRAKHGIFASVGILYNHESALRPATYVSQKIATHAAAVQRGDVSELVIGDLDAVVDWGYAPDYCDAMQRILALRMPGDFVIASGEGHSVREFVEVAFGALGLDWTKFVREDRSRIRRPSTVRIGNAAKLEAETGWTRATGFEDMIAKMLEANGATIVSPATRRGTADALSGPRGGAGAGPQRLPSRSQ